jgi:hypothetical protein
MAFGQALCRSAHVWVPERLLLNFGPAGNRPFEKFFVPCLQRSIMHAQCILLPLFLQKSCLGKKVSGWIQHIICIVLRVQLRTMGGRDCLVFLVAICGTGWSSGSKNASRSALCACNGQRVSLLLLCLAWTPIATSVRIRYFDYNVVILRLIMHVYTNRFRRGKK